MIMYLKQLEIQGFKSFADRIKINFESGITAVVGPNGCGKSNVVDALRWVLGETNPRRIRCLRENDVIFHGSSTRPQVGFARVNLLLDNSSSWLNIDCSEVQITRKLYANGESGYFINNESVRMKDIKELFMNTGVMTNSYSTIQLAEVQAILESSPEQIRVLFDEAAGVTKYRSHREEARRRIDRTRGDLDRIRDIIRELEQEIKLLDSQARKAKKFENLKVKLSEGMVNNILSDYKENFERKEELKKNLTVQSDKHIAFKSKLSKAEAALEKQRMELDVLEERLASRQAENALAVSEKKVLEERLSFASSRLKALPGEMAQASQKQKRAEKELLEQKPVLEKLSSQKDEIEKTLNEIKAASGAKASLFDEKLQAAKSVLFQTVHSLVSVSNGIKTAEDGIEELAGRISKNRDDSQKIENEILRLDGEIKEAKNKSAQAAEEIKRKEEIIGKLNAGYARADKLRGELKEKAEGLKMDKLRLETGSAGKRLEYESFVKRVSGDRDFLGDFESSVEIGEKWKEAFSVLFSNFPKVVFVRNAGCIKKMKDAGAVPYIIFVSAEDIIKYSPGNLPSAVPPEDIIRGKNEHAEKFIKILFDKFIFADRDAQEGTEKFIFSSDGSVGFPFGRAFGGSGGVSDADEDISLKEKEIDGIEKRRRDSEEEINKLTSGREKALREISSLREEVIESGAKIRNLESAKSGKAEILKEMSAERANLEKAADNLRAEIEKNKKEEMVLKEKHQIQVENLSSAEKTVASAEETRSHISAAENEAKKQKCERFMVEYEGALSSVGRFEEEKSGAIKTVQQISNEEKHLNERAGKMKDDIDAIAKREKKFTEDINALKQKQQSERAGLNVLQKNVSSVNSQVYETQKSKEIVTGEIMHLGESLQALEYRLKEEYSLTVDEGFKKYEHPVKFSEEDIIRLRARVEALGSVNLLAPEDYERVKKRYDFLIAQSTDLEKAIEDITKIISEANKQIRENFVRTFEIAKENFKAVYTNFFEGGRADIRLTDEANPLESGVEVEAEPPGKKINSNRQLSSGENALTAIALLFALFRIKPSPFCVLDEIDAPLDDANVVRFSKLIREFSKNIQFITITHNKRTMEMADVIYGVTMEEFGVSKLVSVKYRKFIGEGVGAR
ncbi:MAG: chromosome segregation protein SMC [bacterium]